MRYVTVTNTAMIVRILLDGKPCGVTCLSAESAKDYIGHQRPEIRPRLTWQEETQNNHKNHEEAEK